MQRASSRLRLRMGMRRLTDILIHVPTPLRIKYRRRIEMIADWWALKLRSKHGEAARARCIQHQIATAKNGAELRNHIWSLVNRSLRSKKQGARPTGR